jgi:hypothetical protein
MKNPEKYPEVFFQTIKRTIITTIIIAAIITWCGIFPSGDKSKLVLFGISWSAVFCIVFGGHWLELVFINYIKFGLPRNIVLLYLLRIPYWFLSSVPLFFIAGIVANLFSNKPVYLGRWWMFGFIYIVIELLMHAIMQVRYKKSFYNGIY